MGNEHCIRLVQAIASGKWVNLHALMVEWEVPLQRAWCRSDGVPTFEGMCIMLAQHLTETKE